LRDAEIVGMECYAR